MLDLYDTVCIIEKKKMVKNGNLKVERGIFLPLITIFDGLTEF